MTDEIISYFNIRKKRKQAFPEIPYVYLTFGDPATESMYVTYHIEDDKTPVNVYYREKGSAAEWQMSGLDVRDYNGMPFNICHCKCSGLSPDTDYEFKVGEDSKLVGQFGDKVEDLFYFKTMAQNVPIKGAFGADYQDGPSMWVHITELMVAKDIDFMLVAGDWVNDDGRIERAHRWYDFWAMIFRKLIRSDGRMIPYIAGAGNHEAWISGDMDPLLFTDMFPFPNEGDREFHGSFDLNDDIKIVAIDTEIESGAGQNSWMDGVFTANSDKKFLVPYYHRVRLPSHRGSASLMWIETFENHGIRACFGGHDHTYHRSHEIIIDGNDPNGARLVTGEEKGIIEFGDGNLGTKYYAGDLLNEWYVDDSGTQFSHCYLVEFQANKIIASLIDQDDNIVSTKEIDL